MASCNIISIPQAFSGMRRNHIQFYTVVWVGYEDSMHGIEFDFARNHEIPVSRGLSEPELCNQIRYSSEKYARHYRLTAIPCPGHYSWSSSSKLLLAQH